MRFLLTLCALLNLGSLVLAWPSRFSLRDTKFLFSFGDSYTDTGFQPNGTLANKANPLGNPAFPGFTSSGGENWVGFLIDKFNKTKTFSYNYAFSGATLDPALAKPFSPTVVSVMSQIRQEFIPGLGARPSAVPWHSHNSLFAIFDGINDVLNIDGSGNQTTAQVPFFTLYQSLVNELYDTGARNFLFVGVPAIDLTPFVMQQGPNNPSLARTSLIKWNENVHVVMKTLRANHSDVNVFFADMDTLYQDIVADPPAFGIANVSSVWFNTLHPVAQVHVAMARRMARVLG